MALLGLIAPETWAIPIAVAGLVLDGTVNNSTHCLPMGTSTDAHADPHSHTYSRARVGHGR
jgi:hypothetical protein